MRATAIRARHLPRVLRRLRSRVQHFSCGVPQISLRMRLWNCARVPRGRYLAPRRLFPDSLFPLRLLPGCVFISRPQYPCRPPRFIRSVCGAYPTPRFRGRALQGLFIGNTGRRHQVRIREGSHAASSGGSQIPLTQASRWINMILDSKHMHIRNINRRGFTPLETMMTKRKSSHHSVRVKKKFLTGFTRIEVVVYVALLGVLSVFVVNSFMQVVNLYARARAEREALANARGMLEIIVKKVAQAQ